MACTLPCCSATLARLLPCGWRHSARHLPHLGRCSWWRQLVNCLRAISPSWSGGAARYDAAAGRTERRCTLAAGNHRSGSLGTPGAACGGHGDPSFCDSSATVGLLLTAEARLAPRFRRVSARVRAAAGRASVAGLPDVCGGRRSADTARGRPASVRAVRGRCAERRCEHRCEQSNGMV